ncbi:MAG TPA: DJ-1/PfpI family protein [Blastocatellia bacterium]|nr:DJ-1/PfpI family protein [Blastocatellia bacterium]
MNIAIVAFDEFTDIDVFFMWDLLKRIRVPEWTVRIVGNRSHHTSTSGLTIPMQGTLETANSSDAVLFASGPGTRKKIKDQEFLKAFGLNPERQLIGSMCSGALILAALGLLEGKQATTYPSAKTLLERFGVEVVEKSFVLQGNVATAAGCLAAQYLAGWVIESFLGSKVREAVLKSIMPVGEGLSFAEPDIEDRIQVYAAASIRQVGSSPKSIEPLGVTAD